MTGRAQADPAKQTSGIVTGDGATTPKMDSPCNWIFPLDASGQEGTFEGRIAWKTTIARAAPDAGARMESTPDTARAGPTVSRGERSQLLAGGWTPAGSLILLTTKTPKDSAWAGMPFREELERK